MEQFKTGILTPERLEPLKKYLEDDSITNIDWHGNELWIKTIYNESYRADNSSCNAEYIENLISNIANSKSKGFNTGENRLEVENEELHLRITAVHDSVSMTGNCLFLRKTTAKCRYNYDDLISNHYISEKLLNFLINCTIAGCNIMAGGVPDAGKSEFGKYLSLYIPDNQNVITIEDAQEWYYKTLKPNAACVSLRVNDTLPYSQAIALCMRLNADRILFTEARSVEVKDLVTLWNTGVPGICTIHAGKYQRIPDRILNMMPSKLDAERLENDIYDDLDIGLIIKKKKMEDGKVGRYLDQLGFFDRQGKENIAIDYFINGENVADKIPQKILDKLDDCNIQDPFSFPKDLRR